MMIRRDRLRHLAAGKNAIAQLALVVSSLFLALPLAAQTTDPVEKVGRLAINFDELKDWNPTWVFTDAMKIARPWLPQVPGTLAPWDTGAPITTDANGWPILNWGQSAATLLCREIGGVYPGGVYNVHFEGNGSMEYALDAQLLANVGPGHDQIFVAPSDTGMLIKIAHSDPNNHVRNVQVVLPGMEPIYQTQTFHPEFLAAIEPFGALRFMQWQNTNFSTLTHWWERPTADYWTQAGDFGISVEYMVELANVTGKAPWFCIPYLATDDFVREFGRYVAQNLNPEIPAYIEYSNEVWNNTFPAFGHASWNGLNQGLGVGTPGGAEQFFAAWKWYSERSVRVFDLWTQEFQAVPGPPVGQRLVRVMAAQHANPSVGETILDHNQAYAKTDVLAVAPYMGYSFGITENLQASLNKSNDQIITELENELNWNLFPTMVQNVQIAQSRGLDLIAYEGGQHLVGVGSAQTNAALTAKFISVNRDPRMYDLYTQFLQRWDESGAEFMTPYSFIGRFTEFGSWGHKEYLNQPLSEAHKHRALVDWADGGSQGPPPVVTPAVNYYGLPCQNLWMGHFGEPKPGAFMSFSVANAPPLAAASLMVSNTNVEFSGVPLPIDLSGLGQIGCQMLIGQPVLLPTQISGTGYQDYNLVLPNNPALIGTHLYFQWVVDIPSFGFMGIGLSNAVDVTIGS